MRCNGSQEEEVEVEKSDRIEIGTLLLFIAQCFGKQNELGRKSIYECAR